MIRWERSGAWLAAVAVATGGALFAMATPAHADGWPYGFGYVWVNEPSTPIGTTVVLGGLATRPYNLNSTGVHNEVTRTATGRYTVRFPNLGPHGTALVTAYGTATGHPDDWCNLGLITWTGVDTSVAVQCFSHSGPADSPFTLTYALPHRLTPAPAGLEWAGYLWNVDPSPAPGTVTTPAPAYQYNATGALNTVVRTGVGRYHVTFPGLSDLALSNIQAHVTAYASGVATSCQLEAAYVGSNDLNAYADVVCVLGSQVRDSQFTMQFAIRGNTLFAPTTERPTAHLRVLCPSVSGCVVNQFPYPSQTWVAVVPTDRFAVSYLGAGEFRVDLKMPIDYGTVNVTPIGTAIQRCKVYTWSTASGIRVRCYALAGEPATSGHFYLGFAA